MKHRMQEYDVALSVPPLFQGPKQYKYTKDDKHVTHWSPRFILFKVVFDKVGSIVGLGLGGIIALVLLVLNPFLNPGPLLYRQERLGKNKKRFVIYKFRTMIAETHGKSRSATGALEEERITPLGKILRKSRLDETPNFFNVLRGDMSIVGPRPETASHAEHYLRVIDHYDYRFKVKPGITGLAQIESGYAEGAEATSIKAHYDQIYIETSSGRLDLYIAIRTLFVMLTGFGAR